MINYHIYNKQSRFARYFQAILACIVLIFSSNSSFAKEPATVRINNGRIEERVNGTLRRSYGSNLVDADTDGITVAGVTKDGRIMEYKNGTLRRTFGSNVNRVQVQNGIIYAQLKSGKTAEYDNGTLKRTY